jgi:hypothetical protein
MPSHSLQSAPTILYCTHSLTGGHDGESTATLGTAPPQPTLSLLGRRAFCCKPSTQAVYLNGLPLRSQLVCPRRSRSGPIQAHAPRAPPLVLELPTGVMDLPSCVLLDILGAWAHGG